MLLGLFYNTLAIAIQVHFVEVVFEVAITVRKLPNIKYQLFVICQSIHVVVKKQVY